MGSVVVVVIVVGVLGRLGGGVRCEGRSQCCSSSPGRQGMRALKHSVEGAINKEPAGCGSEGGRWQ